MSEPELSPEEKEFSDQLKTLFTEAQQSLGEMALAPEEEAALASLPSMKEPTAQDLSPRQALGFLQLIRPLVMGMDALTRASAENSAALAKVQQTLAEQGNLPEMLEGIQKTLDQKNVINQQLFDSLHSELKSYKDNFLLDVFHKPIVRDLVTLYDDLSEIRRQNLCFESELRKQKNPAQTCVALLERMGTLNANLDHAVAALLEVMARMDVHVLNPSKGKLDKKQHRAVAVEPTEVKADDNDIIRTVKRGFLWRDRPVRPEEVVIKKWKEGYLVALESKNQANEGL
jgi:molecular chaperone GrpE (heat shock protein)